MAQQQFNPYAGNYAAFSQALSQNLAEQRTEEAHLAELKRQGTMDNLRQAQLLDMKIKQNEELMIPADTGINTADTYIQKASRQLVDQASNLKNQLKNGEIDNEVYAQQMAGIRNQVPQLKTFKDNLMENIQAYQDGIAGGTLSNAMKYGDDFYSTLLSPDSQVEFGLGENGQVGLYGVSGEGNPIEIPLSGMGQMPQVMMKTQSPQEQLMPAFQAMAAGKLGWDDEAATEAQTMFDNMVGGGKNNLFSMAMDHYGMTYDEAQDLYEMPQGTDENGVQEENHLAQVLQEKWTNDAKTIFNGTKIQIEQQQQEQMLEQRLKEARIRQMERANQSVTNMKIYEAEQQRKRQENYLANVVQAGDYSALSGWNGVQNVVEQDGKVYLMGKDESNPLMVVDPSNPQAAFMQLNTAVNNFGAEPRQFSPYQGDNQPQKTQDESLWGRFKNWWSGDSPTNRLSPLDRGRAASKARENEATKAAHAETRAAESAEMDRQREEENIGWGDIAAEAAGGLPYVGALAGAGKAAKLVKGIAKGAGSHITAGAKGAGGAVADALGNIATEQDLTNMVAGGAKGGAIGAAKGYVKGKLKDQGKKVLKKAGKAILGNAGDIAGAVGKGVGIAGTAAAAVNTAKKYNQMMRQNMSDEEYENYKRTGSTTGSRRGTASKKNDWSKYENAKPSTSAPRRGRRR